MVNLKTFQDYKEYAKLTFSKLCIIQFSKDAVSWFGDLYNVISSHNKNSTKISVISRYTEYVTNYMCLFRVCETTVKEKKIT